jgi:hypothetical protein
MLQAQAVSSRDRRECSNLVHDEVFDFTCRRAYLSPSEAHEVRKAGMNADGYAMLSSQSNRLTHDAGIAGVEAAGDVGRRDGGHQQRVLAELISPE